MGVEPVHRAGQAVHGWLGNHTSSIDWCEDNYALTRYVAEFFNTASNIPFIFLGLHGAVHTYSESLPNRQRVALLHLGIAFIGVGSFIFHATLKWNAQVMLDELPMIFVSSLALYLLVADEIEGSKGKKLAVKVGLALVPTSVSAVYLAYPDPLLHQICYALIQVASTIRVYQLYGRPQLQAAQKDQSKFLMNSGTLLFLSGFLIWNLDNIYCDSLTSWRSYVGEYIGSVSQGHAWWHILTGLGGNRIVTGISYLTLSLKYPGEYTIAHSMGFLPYVQRRVDGQTNKIK